MKNILYIFITLLISTNGFSQCADIEKLETGGTYGGRPYKNAITFKYDLDWSKYCCDINKIKPYADFILPISKSHIINRAGTDFFKKLKIHYLMVRYPKSVKIDYSKKRLYELSKFKNYSYWIVYEYWNDGIEYGFGLEFDKNGKLISENEFPNLSLNPEFEKLTEPCIALEKVKSDERFKGKKIDFIELAYLDSINSFCWLVKEKVPEPTKLGLTQYSIVLFYINANTNKIELVKQQKGNMIACGVTKAKIIKKED